MAARRIATTAGVAALLLGGLMAGPAHAEVSTKKSCFGSASYPGIVCFYPKGDVFKVEDRSRDGLRVVARWETSYGRTGACTNKGGAYTVKTCNYNMAEGKKISFRMEARDGGKLHSAWDWRSATI